MFENLACNDQKVSHLLAVKNRVFFSNSRTNMSCSLKAQRFFSSGTKVDYCNLLSLFFIL
jgi:hypothetical protein